MASQIDDRYQRYGHSPHIRPTPSYQMSCCEIYSEKPENRDAHSDQYGPYNEPATDFPLYCAGKGILIDYQRRWKYYWDDWLPAKVRQNPWPGIRKWASGTTCVLATVLIPVMALGSANAANTKNVIDVRQTAMGQILAGLIFSVFSTQPLGVLATTPPITHIISLVYLIAADYHADFGKFYACTGVFIGMWLIVYGIFNMSKFLKYVKPATEESFAIFVAFALIMEAVHHATMVYGTWYAPPRVNVTNCVNHTNPTHPSRTGRSVSSHPKPYFTEECIEDGRAKALAYTIISFTAASVATGLHFIFRHVPYFTKSVRELWSSYASIVAIIVSALVWNLPAWGLNFKPYEVEFIHRQLYVHEFWGLSATQTWVAFGISIPLSLLFYFDQGFTAMVVNNSENGLSKPGGYHADLFLVGIINVIMSIFGFPWLHLTNPVSDFHMKHVATIKYTYKSNDMHSEIERGSVSEQRVTTLLAHLLMIIFVVPSVFDVTFRLVPLPAAMGILWFQAIASLQGNDVVERCFLLLTDRKSYPDSHYMRKVPMLNVAIFSVVTVLEAVMLIVMGYFVTIYAKFTFPVLIVGMILIREYVLPRLVNRDYGGGSLEGFRFTSSYLDTLDSHRHWAPHEQRLGKQKANRLNHLS